MEHIQGFTRSHWAPPLGDYSPRIAPADAMVIDFQRKKSSCGVVKSLSEASIQKAQNGPSTQLIKATSCVERLNATIKAEELSYLSFYQGMVQAWVAHFVTPLKYTYDKYD
jgi:hypothetical protein